VLDLLAELRTHRRGNKRPGPKISYAFAMTEPLYAVVVMTVQLK
jgi:hypothetical protein